MNWIFLLLATLLGVWITGIAYLDSEKERTDHQVNACIVNIGPMQNAREWCEAIVATKGEFKVFDERWPE